MFQPPKTGVATWYIGVLGGISRKILGLPWYAKIDTRNTNFDKQINNLRRSYGAKSGAQLSWHKSPNTRIFLTTLDPPQEETCEKF
jgi:hypothetical protein